MESPPLRPPLPAALCHGLVSARSGTAVFRVYNPAKTVADCIKFRQKIGLDVAVKALREGWREKMFNRADLTKAAEVCRIRRVMQP